MRLILPRTLMLDSSTLNGMERDFWQQPKRRRLERVLRTIEDQGWVMVLTAHHFIELLRHENDQVAEGRLRFLHWIAGRPQVAWIQTAGRAGGLGTALDVVAREIEAQLRYGADPLAIVERVREQILRFGPPPVSEWRDLDAIRPVLRASMEREREVASIIAADSTMPSEETIGELRKVATRSPSEAQRVVRQMGGLLGEELTAKGDRRLRAPGSVAQRFMDSVAAELPEMNDDSSIAIDQMIRHAGMDPDDVSDDLTFGEFSYLLESRRKIEICAQVVGLSASDVTHVSIGSLPSLQLQQALKLRRLRAHPRASGGDLTDAYLAGFTPYFDHVIVDRRTHEYLRQIDRASESAVPLGAFSKLARYEDLPDVLS